MARLIGRFGRRGSVGISVLVVCTTPVGRGLAQQKKGVVWPSDGGSTRKRRDGCVMLVGRCKLTVEVEEAGMRQCSVGRAFVGARKEMLLLAR